LGAAAGKYAEMQAARLAQLRGVSPPALDAFIGSLAKATALPQVQYHFERHGADFGAATTEDYRRLFLDHIRRADLRYFTCVHPRFGSRMWYLVGMDDGAVAQYNQSRQVYWSFYRVTNLGKFLEFGRGWWVEVVRTPSGWEAKPWV